MSDDYKPRDGSKLRWKSLGDGTGRQRFEQSHPWNFTQPIGVNLEGGCSCPRNDFGFKAGCPHLGKQRKGYPRPKAAGRF